jgi:hypothetical protein
MTADNTDPKSHGLASYRTASRLKANVTFVIVVGALMPESIMSASQFGLNQLIELGKSCAAVGIGYAVFIKLLTVIPLSIKSSVIGAILTFSINAVVAFCLSLFDRSPHVSGFFAVTFLVLATLHVSDFRNEK